MTIVQDTPAPKATPGSSCDLGDEGEDGGEGEEGTGGFVFTQDYVEFRKDGQTTRLRATSALRGVPLVPDDFIHNIPDRVIMKLYTAAGKAEAGQLPDRPKFTERDGTRGYPIAVISDLEDLPQPVGPRRMLCLLPFLIEVVGQVHR